MKVLLTTALLMLAVAGSMGQELSILSASDSLPVPYASVAYYEGNEVVGGQYSNKQGRVVLDTSLIFDRIEIGHVAYHPKVIRSPYYADTAYYLRNKERVLGEAAVFPRRTKNAPTKEYGYSKKWHKVWVSGPAGYALLTCLNLGTKKDFVEVKSMSFYVKDWGRNCGVLFKPLFYENEQGRPGRQIVVDTVYRIEADVDGRISYDLPARTYIPGKSVFTGVEIIKYSGGNYQMGGAKARLERKRNYGKSILCNKVKGKDTDQKTFLRYKPFTDGWQVYKVDGHHLSMALTIEVYR
ncbi:MAG: hypothetical protein RI565_11125 [Schleiferiaceae bacterium]|nr:hypothetical protein [Schleiferiaceae bacterium]